MAKTSATRGRRRQSKRLTPGVVEEGENTSTEDQAESDSTDIKTEVKDKVTADAQDAKAESDSADVKPENGDVKAEGDCVDVKTKEEKEPKTVDVEEDPAENGTTDVKADAEEEPKTEEAEGTEEAEVDTVIEVKGSAPTVNVSWEKKEEEEEVVTGGDDQEKTDDAEMSNDTEVEKASVPEAEVPVEESEENPTVEATEEHGESDEEVKHENDKENGKRKAEFSLDSSPSKKTKVINDGYCLFVGNLNNSTQYEELKTALANFFVTQSILVQDIRLDKAKKHAFVDVSSEMDLTKALALNGEPLLDKPMKIYRAKVKMADQLKVKNTQEVKKTKDERTLFVKNIPYTATREDLLKVFPKAIHVRFLGGTDSPSKGIAFVEFINKDQASAARQKGKKAKIQERLLYVDVIGGHTKNDSNNNTEIEANNTLFVSNLPYKVQETHLKKVFGQAVKINIPQSDGKAKGYAFVEFASVSDAEKALKSSQNSQVHKRPLKVQFCVKSKTEEPKVLSNTLIILGLDENTTADTLKEAFDGALSARINVDKDTGASRKFGFVDFESAESCKSAKESMEDCEIDGCKVTVAFARPKRPERESGGRGRGHNFGGRGNRGGKGRGSGRPFLKKKEMKQVN